MSNNPEDITKGSGPLKGVRGADLYGDDFDREDLVNSIRRLGQISQNNLWRSQTGRSGNQYVGMPGFMEAYNLPEGTPGSEYGNSRFDRGVMVAPTEEDIANKRADAQTGIGKLLNGVSKGVVLAGTTFLDGTLGLAYGIVDAAQAGIQGDKEWYARLWDNSVSNGLQQINQLSEEALPNFRSAEEMNRSWYQNLGTMNFWADSFLKNIGFTVGAFYSGGAFTKLLKGAHLLKSGLGAAAIGSLYSAINEGRIEANNNTDDWKKLQEQQIDDYFSDRAQELAYNATSEQEYRDGILALDEQRQKALSDVQDNAAGVGLIDLLSNVAILSATNFLTYGRVYSKGFETAKLQAEKAGRQVSRTAAREAADKALAETEGKSFAKLVKKVGEKYEWNDITKAKILFNGARTALREGNEEMAQAMAAEFAGQVYTPDSPETYYRLGLDDVAKKQTDDLFDTIISSFVNTYGNKDRYEEFAVGALTGLLGMPTFGAVNNSSADTYLGRGKKVGLTGGLAGEFASAKEMNAQGKAAVQKMNEFLDKFREDKMPFYRRTSLSNAMDGWVAKDNKFEYKNAEDTDLFETIKQFSKMGKLSDLKELIDDAFYDVSDEQLQSIATSFDSENTNEGEASNYRDTEGKLLSDTPEGREIMRSMLKNKGDAIKADIDDYEKSLQYVRNVSGDSRDTERTDELAWMHWKLGKFSSRYSSLVNENSESLHGFVNNAETRLGIIEEELKKTRDSLASAADDKKEGYQETLEALNLEKDVLSKAMDFSKRLVASKDIHSFLVSLPEKVGEYLSEAYKAYMLLLQDGNVAASTGFMASLGALADVPAIIGAWNSFNQTLQEFIKNPAAMDKAHKKIDDEKKVVNEEKAKQDVVKKHEGKSAKDLADLSDEEFAELDNLDNLPDELKEKKELADEIRQSGVQMFSASDTMDISDEDKDALKDILSKKTPSERDALLKGEEELSPEEIASFSAKEELEAWKKSTEEKNGALSAEEIAAAEADLKRQKAEGIMDELRAAINEGKETAAKMPGKEAKEKKVDAPKLTAEQQAEQEKFARMLAQPLMAAAIIKEVQDAQVRRVNNFLDRIRYWRKKSPENLWALIHNDDMYKEVTAASSTPGLDESIIVDFLKNKVIFPDSDTGEKAGNPAPKPSPAPQRRGPEEQQPSPSPSPTPSPAPSPAPATEQGAEEAREEVEDAQTAQNDRNTYSKEAVTIDGKLVLDEHNQIQNDVNIPGLTAEQNAELVGRRKYLASVGAFAGRYNGLVYPGKSVHFEIREDANASAENIMILIVDDSGNVLGDMRPAWGAKTKAMRDWITNKEEEYREYVRQRKASGQDIGTYRLSETTTIKENTTGTLPFIPDSQSGVKTALPLRNIMWTTGADGNAARVPITLGLVTYAGSKGLLFSKNTPKTKKVGNTSIYKEGDIVLLLPTGSWVMNGNELEMEYEVVPLSNVESVYNGENTDPITRAFNAWKSAAIQERDSSDEHKVSNFGELASLLNRVFGTFYDFQVKPEKINGLQHVVVERATMKFYAANNFAGNNDRNREEDRTDLRTQLLGLGMKTEDVDSVLKKVLSAKNAEEARQALAAVLVPEGTRLSYNPKDKSVSIVHVIFRGILDDGAFTSKLAEAFTGERVRGDARALNSTFKFLGKDISYNELLSGSLRVNMAPGVGRTINSFFTLEEFDMSSRHDPAPAPAKAETQPAASEAASPAPQAQPAPQPAAQQKIKTRQQMLDELKEELGSSYSILMESFTEYLTDEVLSRVNENLPKNAAILRDMLERFDTEADDAEEVWEETYKKFESAKPEKPVEFSPAPEKPSEKSTVVKIKDEKGRVQEYTVSGRVIRNKKGEEVFAKDQKKRRQILLEASVNNGLTVKIGNTYVSRLGAIYDSEGVRQKSDLALLRQAFNEGKFADGVDKSGLGDAAYAWLAITEDEKRTFIQRYFMKDADDAALRNPPEEIVKQAEKRWTDEMSYEDRAQEIRCY